MVAIGPTLLGLLFVIFGLVAFAGGVDYVRKWNWFSEGEETTIKDAPRIDGGVKIEGEVQDVDNVDLLKAPLTGEDCIAYNYKVEKKKRKRSSSSSRGSRWVVEDSGEDVVPFKIDDGTGVADVDSPEDADLSIGLSREYNIEGEGDLPEKFERSSFSLGDLNIKLGKRRRYKEGRLEPGDEGFVYADVESDTDYANVERKIVDSEDSRMFVISDGNMDETRKRFRNKGFGAVIFGTFFVGVGIYVILGAL